VQGIIAIDTACTDAFPPPTVSVSGHREVPGITNIILDHKVAARLAMRHLKDLGHSRIALFKGPVLSSDSEVRWQSILCAARELGLGIHEQLHIHLDKDSSSPQVGYQAAQQLLARNLPFSALIAFNDTSAIGAIQSFREAGKQVPGDISVIGFDDIRTAAFLNPGLTTIRQPLRQMGVIAAETLLRRITKPGNNYPVKIVIKPELIVRGTTSRAAKK
jgi:LacI family transcriptional regulator